MAIAIAIGALASTNGIVRAEDGPAEMEHDAGFVAANGITLAYESFGPADREVILLIAGAGAPLTMWPDELCEELVRRGYRVIRFDNRDTGLSTHLDALGHPDWEALFTALAAGTPVPAPYTMSDMTNDAVGLLDALGIAQAHLVGASMGGHIAQRIAIEHPARARSLTSISSDTGNPEMPGPTETVLALPPPPPAGSPPEDIIARELLVRRTLASPAYPTDDQRLREEIRRDLARGYDAVGLERQTAAILAEGDRREALRQLALPTVVLHGDSDLLVPVANGHDTAANIPGAELRIIEGMGHDIPLQLIPDFADAITAAASAAATAAAPAAGIPGSRVVGAGMTTLGEGFPADFRGDRIFVGLDAFATPDQQARGTFTITHREPDGALFADLRGEVTCLEVEAEHAVVIGVITAARTPGLPGGDVHEGMIAAIVVQDGGPDGDRFGWTFGDPEMVPDCADLPVAAPAAVEQGNFDVHHE
jgi:pimeloyl-ACP methyl ester carboxylesterase